jgi:hypothetical protein
MFGEPVGALKYPFITPGSSSYNNTLWDWDSWLSNIALRQILLDKGSEKNKEIAKAYEGRYEYKKRTGIEGTLSQGIRRGTVRRSRYIGLSKTHLQEVATAAGINLLRTIKLLESSADSQNTNFKICKFGVLNSATVSYEIFDTLKTIPKTA